MSWLEEKGYVPDERVSPRNGAYFFYALDNEKTGHTKVDPKRNVWHDKSLGQGGGIIQLKMKLEGKDFLTALKELKEEYILGGGGGHRQGIVNMSMGAAKEKEQNPLQAVEVRKPSRKMLLHLAEKKLDMELCRETCVEVVYRNIENKEGGNYYGVGIKNESGGYNIRQGNGMKLCVGDSDISVFGKNNQSRIFAVFEGMTDYLAYLTDKKITSLRHSKAIVLHGVGNLSKAVSHLQKENAEVVNLFLDNDNAGKLAVAVFNEKLSSESCKVVDRSGLYEGFKDYNKFLIEKERGKGQGMEVGV